MKPATSASLVAFALNAAPALAAVYSQTQNIVGSGFYDAFDFQAIPDPTAGRVNYVDRATAESTNLTFATGDKFVLRADDKTVLNAQSAGRNSVRIRSKETYTTHAAVFDVSHMPQGCGTWPAIWETDEASWPAGGEVDIVEGVNDQASNQMTLHTSAGCTMPVQRDQTGTTIFTNCDANFNGNAGCSVGAGSANSYGPPFNANGGGWYAMERTDTFINVWFWPRNAGNVPADVKANSASVDTSAWGTPTANFPNTNCNFPEFFRQNNIIINLTFCGAWAGDAAIYAASGCPSTCNAFVEENPSAFSNAYFEFNAIRVFV
ncbi:Glycoside hydrolase family 16 protein [Mycena kentingensis (nom. inval.)]|nr:Glycoside hydrolase family 16 protein [Mycena kentingensis (nom. inval.)]